MMLLNAILAGGLAALLAPIVVHILHRRRITRIDWGAMRFLIDMMTTNRRRIVLSEWLLLLLRIALLALIALALTRPALQRAVDTETVHRPAEKIGAVLLIDNSVSSRMGRDRPRLELLQDLALAYLATLDEGDEVSLLTTGQLDAPPADPIYDLDAARAMIERIEPSHRASDVPALLQAGWLQLQRHLNLGAEVVLITDGLDQGWRSDDRALWGEVQDAYTTGDRAMLGTRTRPRLVHLHPAVDADRPPTNLAVRAVSCDRALIDTRTPVTIVASLIHDGAYLPDDLTATLAVDGRVVDRQPVDAVAANGEVVFRHRFEESGSHAVRVAVAGSRDWMALDDARALSVQVIDRLPVLLVEGEPGSGRLGSLGFLALALAPHPDPERNLVVCERIGVEDLERQDFDRYRTVVLGDVEALGDEALAALESYVAAGGGVLVTLGAHIRPALVNRLWARGGDGFLPASLDAMHQAEEPVHPAFAAVGHPALSAFTGTTAEAWRDIEVRRWFPLAEGALGEGELQVLLSLQGNDPLLVERRRGLGRVVLCTTGLDPAWSDLVVRRSFMPLMRGVVGYLGSIVQPPRNLRPGDLLVHDTVNDLDGELVVPPEGAEPLPLRPGTWEGRRVYVAGPVEAPGVYRVDDGADTCAYAVGLDDDESRVEPLATTTAARAVGRLTGTVTCHDPDEVARTFGSVERERVEFWRWLLLGAVLALVGETLYTRRLFAREHRESDHG